MGSSVIPYIFLLIVLGFFGFTYWLDLHGIHTEDGCSVTFKNKFVLRACLVTVPCHNNCVDKQLKISNLHYWITFPFRSGLDYNHNPCFCLK